MRNSSDPIDNNEKPKGNKFTSWWKGYGHSVKEEFSSRIGSSLKRVIKFLGLAIIPILYAVICIVAFWNPIPNIGKANVTFIDQEQEVLVMTNLDFGKVLGANAKPVLTNKNYTVETDPANAAPNFLTTVMTKNPNPTDDKDKTDAYLELKGNALSSDLLNRFVAWANANGADFGTTPVTNVDQTEFSVSANQNAKDTNGGIVKALNAEKTDVMGGATIDGSIGSLAFAPVSSWSGYFPQSYTSTDADYIKNAHYVYKLSAFELLLATGMIKTDGTNSDLEKNTYYTDPLTNQNIALKNIHYQKYDNKGKNTWHSYKSYIQLKINDDFMRSVSDYLTYNLELVGYISRWVHIDATTDPTNPSFDINAKALVVFLNGDILKAMGGDAALIASMVDNNSWNNGDYKNNIDRLTNSPLEVWTTFARNFLFGYYINTINEFKEAIPMQMIQSAIADGKLDSILGSLLGSNAALLNSITTTTGLNQVPNATKAINIDIEGVKNGLYGIGLGEFFLMIGMYVGTLVHTFVYDRAKRGGPKTSHSQWYVAKWTLMVVTGFIQATVLTLVLSAIWGPHLGAVRMVEIWGTLLICELAFATTIQALWFSIKDETIGKFLCICYMILNLSSGWGTFPSFMQFGFFHAASYITEYTYGLHILGVAVYGGNYASDITYALQNFGILLAFVVVFFSFGFGMSVLRNREMHFGTYRRRHLRQGLEALNMTKEAEIFANEGWKGLEQQNVVYDELVSWMRINHPYEKQFKSYKNKPHDYPIKPNYSDDDIMTRNDDVIV